MKNYEAEKYKKQVKTKEESLLIHIAEMDKLRIQNRILKKKIYLMNIKISELKEQLKQK